MSKLDFRWISPSRRRTLWVSIFLMLTANWALLGQINRHYPLEQHWAFVGSVVVLFTLATAFFLNLLAHGRSSHWVLATFLILSAPAAYFMDRYGTVIDTTMLGNMLQTNVAEASDLFSGELLLRMLVLGLLPAWWLIRHPIASQGFIREARSWAALSVLLIVGMVVSIVPFTPEYASFFREHKQIRFFANPTYYSYSVIKLAGESFQAPETDEVLAVEQDSGIVGDHVEHELIILVVGETARADHFSLNGYAKETNPKLATQNVVSFKQVSSCGTATAISVPCMFSSLGSKRFDVKDARHLENALDILKKNGVAVLWRDNNSDSKHVATRVDFEDFKTSENNTMCDEECRDEGMLVGLDHFIDTHANQDILIVLHQMGNHGPAYYKRYPAEFEQFKPVCKTNELASCTQEEIHNAYDNAILYTDHFLSKTIDFLKSKDSKFETAMLYVSDHGESLGENGMYLHGAPMAFAPKEQTHVPAVAWLGKHFDYEHAQLARLADHPFSHDDLFCILLLGFEVDTHLCENKLIIQEASSDGHPTKAVVATKEDPGQTVRD